MKRIISLILSLAVCLSLCACGGSYGAVDLQDVIAIPEDGIIASRTISQIKNENAIGIFEGSCGELKYEWTIFGSDINEPKDINLGLELSSKPNNEVELRLNSQESFGFSALLSIHLDEKWTADSATAFAGKEAKASVSLTGSKSTILNINLDGGTAELIIKADPLPVDEAPDDEAAPEAGVPEEEDTEDESEEEAGKDNYLSAVTDNDTQVYSDGKDKYLTDPIPEGKPKPVEPEDTEVNKAQAYSCTFSIECSTILNNLDMLEPDKLETVPSNGVILAPTTVTFYEGESVFDVLQRLCREKGIHMESSWTPIYNSAYIEGIHNLYEFDCGDLSGWMYKVNGWYPNYGCSRYQLKDGDIVEWRYTCDLGNDVGRGMG